MNPAPSASVLEFEVYLLATMKYGMLAREAEREAKLADYGLSFGDSERIHHRVAELLADRCTQFDNLRRLVGAGSPGSDSIVFSGILWPEFDFTAFSDSSGAISSARYRRARGHVSGAASPPQQPPWSMDVHDFTRHFGPTTIGYRSDLFDEVLPAHEGHDFDWDGRPYRAGFSWGLFLFASLMWT
ncbi:MAG: hypothetical protein SW019_10460 [Actinomycetota bacterium]|nr:hypothetical protein [Actinomycetota bacterium]